ncbi:MAG TPA: metallophosphoesterase, partial [Chryseosolibacter sp.]|nr:metallophosphoesterase [Chryseosolibacter sp.]
FSTPVCAQVVTGVVFGDANTNGIQDEGERGIPEVVVSGQASVVLTGRDGNYRLDASKNFGVVTVSLPDGYRCTTPSWFSLTGTQPTYNFGLAKIKPRPAFTFLHASDTHISESSVDRMEKLRKIIADTKPDFVLVTGDLVRDALRVPENEAKKYYELYIREVSKLGVPVYSVPGNHEIFGIERHRSLVSDNHPLYGRKMYRLYLGPDYYSFTYGGVHFVGLNSVSYEDLWYFGEIDSVQLKWLKEDLAAVPADMPVVTFQHIPFFSGGLSIPPFEEEGPARTTEFVRGKRQYRHIVTNAGEFMAQLQGRNYPLALAGHYHAQQKFTFAGCETRFEQTGAVLGPVQEGVFKMPSGVTLYTVTNGVIGEGRFIHLD